MAEMIVSPLQGQVEFGRTVPGVAPRAIILFPGGEPTALSLELSFEALGVRCPGYAVLSEPPRVSGRPV